MIVFTKKYHEGVKEGKITLTFRPWDTLKVLRGKIYRAHNLGLLKVIDVDFKWLSNITQEEMRHCGYRNADEFREDYERLAHREVDFDLERSVRVEFSYIGEDIENYKKAMGDVKDSELFNIKESEAESCSIFSINSSHIFSTSSNEKVASFPTNSLTRSFIVFFSIFSSFTKVLSDDSSFSFSSMESVFFPSSPSSFLSFCAS